MKALFDFRRSTLPLVVMLISMLGFTPFANATYFDVDGVVTDCNAFACDLAGINIGDQIGGFLEGDSAASSPNSTFTGAQSTLRKCNLNHCRFSRG